MDTSKGLENIDGVVWFDGQYVDWKDAKVHVLTHTLHYGLGVFEGVRAYSTTQGPTIFRLKDHTDRLFESADTVKLKIPYSKDEINKAIYIILWTIKFNKFIPVSQNCQKYQNLLNF